MTEHGIRDKGHGVGFAAGIEGMELRWNLVKGTYYVVQMHRSGYTNAQYKGFGMFELGGGERVSVIPATVREISRYCG